MRVATGLPPRGVATGAAARWHPYNTLKSTPATTPTPSCASPISPTVVPQNYIRTPVSTLLPAADSFHYPIKSNKRLGSASSLQTPQTSHSNLKERLDVKRAQKEKFENALKGMSFIIHINGERETRAGVATCVAHRIGLIGCITPCTSSPRAYCFMNSS